MQARSTGRERSSGLMVRKNVNYEAALRENISQSIFRGVFFSA